MLSRLFHLNPRNPLDEAQGKALKNAVDAVRQTSIYDRETGLHQRWYFELRIREEADRCNRYDLSMTVATVRLERGTDQETEGEWRLAVLRAAHAINKTVRSVDLVGVLEDGLFCICLIQCGTEGAAVVTERLAHELKRCRIGSVAFPSDIPSEHLIASAQAQVA